LSPNAASQVRVSAAWITSAVCPYGLFQFFGASPLWDYALDAKIFAKALFGFAHRSPNDDANILKLWVGFPAAQHFKPAFQRESQIQNNEVRRRPFVVNNVLKAYESGSNGRDSRYFCRTKLFQQGNAFGRIDGVIFHYQDSHRLPLSYECSAG
jgi:hypothetical protein